MKKRNKTARRKRLLPRRVLADLLTDLCQRIDKQVWLADSFQSVVTPTGDTVHCIAQFQRVLSAALDRHSEGLRDVQGLAEIARDAARRQT